jgi:hypothetical protein
MSNLADFGSPYWRAFLSWAGAPIGYVAHVSGESASVTGAYARGMKAEDRFGNAQEGDLLVVLDAVEFVSKFAQGEPRRFDTLTLQGHVYSVQMSEAAPSTGTPVVFKVRVQGASQ